MTLYLVMAWWPNATEPVPLHHGSGLGVAAYSDRDKALARARREKKRRPDARFAVDPIHDLRWLHAEEVT